MKRFSEQLKKKSERIRMRATERRDLRDRIVSYMEYHPLPCANASKNSSVKSTSVISEPFTTISINKIYTRGFVGVLSVFLIIAIPLFAERSVPGDVLYPVKIQFNEEVRSTLAFSPYAKVAWETQRLERRIAEARLLADEGKLTQEIEEEVALAVQEHMNAAQQEIALLRENDSDEADIATIAFASALAVQMEMLDGQVEQEIDGGGGGDHSVLAIADVVAEVWRDAEVAQVDVRPSYEKLLARIELDTTLAHELFSSVRKGASEEEIANVERRFSDIQRKVSEAIDLHEVQMSNLPEVSVLDDHTEPSSPEQIEGVTSIGAENVVTEDVYTELSEEVVPAPRSFTEEESSVLTSDGAPQKVISLLRDALTDTQKLIGFLADIDVRENVTIEDLVPVTLTDEENIERIQSRIEEAEALRKVVESRDVSVEFSEKVSVGMKALTVSIEKTSKALASGDFNAAEISSIDALAMAQDLNVITDAFETLDEGGSTEEESVDEESLLEEISTSTESRVDMPKPAVLETVTPEEGFERGLEEGV